MVIFFDSEFFAAEFFAPLAAAEVIVFFDIGEKEFSAFLTRSSGSQKLALLDIDFLQFLFLANLFGNEDFFTPQKSIIFTLNLVIKIVKFGQKLTNDFSRSAPIKDGG